ncbi:DUF6262 family protein [Nonomuraea sp. NPDC050536]|uniref:DUF6262 family protein n=1 Tax=Nonomuraea sp. NPDC050536 TaxID=3364366 RepID=UPI0037C6063A
MTTSTAPGADGNAAKRERRIAALRAAAQRKSAIKVKAAEDALRRLIKNGTPVSFQEAGRQAGVSHSFLYGHPDLRERIENLRHQHSSQRGPGKSTARPTARAR